MKKNSKHTIMLGNGKEIDPFNFQPEDFDPLTFATSLVESQRFLGHPTVRLNILNHCILVAGYVWIATRSPRLTKAALWHDGSEAIIPDIPSPIKHHPYFKKVRGIEDTITKQIYVACGVGEITPEEKAIIKEADIRSYMFEADLRTWSTIQSQRETLYFSGTKESDIKIALKLDEMCGSDMTLGGSKMPMETTKMLDDAFLSINAVLVQFISKYRGAYMQYLANESVKRLNQFQINYELV